MSNAKEQTNTPVIHVKNVWKSYDNGAIAVLNGVDLAVASGERVR